MARGVVKWILYLISAGLIFLGLIFIMASYAEVMRFPVGLVLISVAIVIVYFGREKKPIEIRRTINLSGPIAVKELKCPNCGGILNPEAVQVIVGRPYMTCDYCGNKFEVTEEPKW